MKPIFFKKQSDFRKWFEKNADAETQLLVGFYKVGSGKPSITWSQSVDEALCFGWIDSIRNTIDRLFLQSGGGRQETALQRGLSDNEKLYVPNILSLIEEYGFATAQRASGSTIWVPNRSKLKEALEIFRAPQESRHLLAEEVRKL